MDITSLYTVEAHETGAEMQVKDVEGKPCELFLTVAGLDSKLWKKSYLEGRKAHVDDESIDADARSLSGITLGWKGFTKDGEPLPFDRKQVEALYENAPYIKAQVYEFMTSRVNFTKG